MKNTIFFFLITFFCSIINSKEFCSFNDIFNQKKKLFCKNGDLIFGNFKFSSKNNNFEYEIIEELELKVLKKFQSETFLYINKNCDKEKSIKIKEITDYIDSKEIYFTKVIISCYLRNE